MSLSTRITAARGQVPADLLLTNLQLVNVLSGSVYPSEIAIKDSVIVGTGAGYTAAKTIDLGGRYVAPGLIDAHAHIESSLCTPPEFSRMALLNGLTTVITDPHEIANVHGLDGIRFMLDWATCGPLSIYVMVSSCVPATHMATAGAELAAADLVTLRDHPLVLGLAEMMNYPGVINSAPEVLDKITAFCGRVLDGHCPDLRGLDLNAYIAAGIQSDHECTTVEEAREKLEKGLVIFIREATNARNLRPLLPLITPQTSRRICFCTDDRQPADLIDEGSVDHMVRVAITEGGIDPVAAFQMVTLNTAEYFGLHDRGAIAPGRRADLIVFGDLHAPRAEEVYINGQLVVSDGQVTAAIRPCIPTLPDPVHIDWSSVNFNIPARGQRIRVIGTIPDQLVTEERIVEAALLDGHAVADPARDIAKMAVIERHHASGGMGRGFIQGFGLTRGAIAGTVAHDHHNLVVIGMDDHSMMTAARAVAEMGGGLVAVDGDTVLASLALPVGGLMSPAPVEDVCAGLSRLLVVTERDLGSTLRDPFMAMSFMALEVIPTLKLTDQGLVNVEQFDVVDVFVQ